MEEANKDNFWLYNNKLQPVAHTLRNNMTKSEACLWKYVLRAGMMKGYTFRRQRPVLNYVVDFMCKELNLIIEVDGLTHIGIQEEQRDNKRQAELESAGFTVLRFTSNEVLHNIKGVTTAIENWIIEFEIAQQKIP